MKGVGKQTIVHISVHLPDKDHDDFWLDYFPNEGVKSGSTSRPPRTPTAGPIPLKTREVMWEGSRAKGTEHLEVKIKAKQTGTGLLADDDYVIQRGHNVVKSGEAVSGPGYGEQPIYFYQTKTTISDHSHAEK